MSVSTLSTLTTLIITNIHLCTTQAAMITQTSVVSVVSVDKSERKAPESTLSTASKMYVSI